MNRKKKVHKKKEMFENRKEPRDVVPLDQRALVDQGENMRRPLESSDMEKDGDMRGVLKEVNTGRPAE